MKKIWKPSCLLLVSLVVSNSTLAVTGNLSVTASAPISCTISAANALVFPAYVPSGPAVNGSTTIDVECSNGAPFSLSADTGAHSANYTARKMQDSSTDQLNYNLYTDNTYTTVWGDGTNGTLVLSGTGAGTSVPVSVDIYGKIAASQSTSVADAYTDTVNVTVSSP